MNEGRMKNLPDFFCLDNPAWHPSLPLLLNKTGHKHPVIGKRYFSFFPESGCGTGSIFLTLLVASTPQVVPGRFSAIVLYFF